MPHSPALPMRKPQKWKAYCKTQNGLRNGFMGFWIVIAPCLHKRLSCQWEHWLGIVNCIATVKLVHNGGAAGDRLGSLGGDFELVNAQFPDF